MDVSCRFDDDKELFEIFFTEIDHKHTYTLCQCSSGYNNQHPMHKNQTLRLTLITLARGGSVGSGTALQAGRSRVRFPMMSLEFFIYLLLQA